MLFSFGISNKTVKQLRKDKGHTVKELAELMKVSPHLIEQVDKRRLKHVPEPLKGGIIDALGL